MKNYALVALLFIATTGSSCLTQSRPEPTSDKPWVDLDPKAFKKKMKQADVVILDVRTPEETAQGKIAEAVEIDFRNENFSTEIEKLDTSKTYFVYCRSGNRSSQACNLMAQKGFRKLYNMKGGWLQWNEENNK